MIPDSVHRGVQDCLDVNNCGDGLAVYDSGDRLKWFKQVADELGDD